MTLSDFKTAIDSEARRTAAQLERENKRLKAAIRKKEEHIARLEQRVKELEGRK